MTRRFAVVYEAPVDFATATELADRVLCECISWLDEELIGEQRTWLSHSSDGAPLTWKSIKQLALDAGIKGDLDVLTEPLNILGQATSGPTTIDGGAADPDGGPTTG